MIDLIKALGDYLTAEDDLLRPKATQCLSGTLNSLKKDILTPNDISVLTGFYVSKLEDGQCTKETLYGMSSLVDMDSFGPSNLDKVLKGLMEQYDSTKNLASTRYYGLLTLQRIFTKFVNYLIQMKKDKLFIECFLHVASGEKDPRNLLLSFALNKDISSSLNLESFEDELFDILFCYFPISFKPPKEDPYKITQDQLKGSLRSAIASSSAFDKDSYPNLLEKLSSTSPSVKRDTAETINACIANYGQKSLIEHWLEIWNAYKFEVVHGEPDDEEIGVYQSLLNTFTEISKVLTSNEVEFDQFASTLLKDLKESFQNTKTLKQTCLIFGAIAKANNIAYNKAVKLVLAQLLVKTDGLNVREERELIQNLGVFTSAYKDVYGTTSSPKLQDYNNGLKDFKDQILILLGKSLMGSSQVEVSLRTLAITELTNLTTLSDFLSNSELSLIAQYFTETVLMDDNEYVFNSAIGGLAQIAQLDSSVLVEVTLPTLISLLPDADEPVRINGQDKPKEKIFDVIVSISTGGALVNFMVIRLLNKLEQLQTTLADPVPYSFLILSSLQKIITTSESSTQFSTDTLFPSLVKLIHLLLKFPSLNQDDAILESATEILKLIVVFSSKSFHQQLSDDTLSFFTGLPVANDDYYKDLEPINVFAEPTPLINILSKVLAGVNKSVSINNVDSLINKLVEFIKTSSFQDGYVRISYLRFLSLIINKWNCEVSKYENITFDSVLSLEIYTWITKGVLLRIDPKSETFIDVLVGALSDTSLGAMAANSFEVLVVDLSIFEKFKKILNNNVRLLYKQKFFDLVVPKLVEGFNGNDDMKIKSNYLSALSHILKHTKREIINPHLPSFFPLLLQSLNLMDSEVRLASLNTILSSVGEVSDLITSHISSLIPKLLALAQSDRDHLNTEPVRLAAVNCLHSFAMALPLQKVVPYQKEVIRELTPVLDDKKRSVRKGAIDARQAYYELGRTVE